LNKFFQHIINNYIKKKNKGIYFFYYSVLKYLTKSNLILKFEGYKFYATTAKKDLSRWMVRNLVQWDKKNVGIIIKLMRKNNSTFIDCGCNFGAYSIPIAKQFKNNPIYSIDASSDAIKKLKENILLNKIKNIKYLNLGIAEKNKIEYFDDNIKNYNNSGSYRFVKNVTKKKINLYKLDYLFEKKIIKLKKNIIIKIDLEGYDFLALKGMLKILKKFNTTIFFEFSKLLIKNSEFFDKEFTDFIRKNKLNLYDLNFKKRNVNELLHILDRTSAKNETIGDFIITNWKFRL
jgi:FkbM family methyltransferase